MNGAIAELVASTSSTPNRMNVMTIGASQYFLFSFMNCQSSLTTCAFDIHLAIAIHAIKCRAAQRCHGSARHACPIQNLRGSDGTRVPYRVSPSRIRLRRREGKHLL